MGQETLFQAAAKRLSGERYAAPIVLTNSDFRFIVIEQLTEIGVDPGAVLLEPFSRNTAPGILAAALYLVKQQSDALMLVSPCDHAIPDNDAFQAAVEVAVPEARDGKLITFGITPDRPETGYGYLELETTDGQGPIALRRFVEKPDAGTAADMLDKGGFLWNAGIFLFSAQSIIEAFERHAPEFLPPVKQAVDEALPDLGFLRLAPQPWEGLSNLSIDYAVMEKSDQLMVVPFSGSWSDLGGWDAVWREMEPDENGVAQSGGVTVVDCKNSLFRAESDTQQLVGIGLENIVAIAMPDAVLVADINAAQLVKLAPQMLRENNLIQAEAFPRDHRPWGSFESLIIGPRFQVKRIVVHPGAALSLQSHVHRAEHWIVVEGTARVTINDETKLVSENQSVYVPLGAVHRMENPGKVPMVLIEVQTGAYVGEDDIIRYEDDYARG